MSVCQMPSLFEKQLYLTALFTNPFSPCRAFLCTTSKHPLNFFKPTNYTIMYATFIYITPIIFSYTIKQGLV